MGLLVVLGEAARVSGFSLGGATVASADSPEAVRQAWEHLPDDVALVILTEQAAAALDVDSRAKVLRVVMPS
ncbi:MAG TPA: V-type ATP synthase subunit F [Acidimicrobiales bacterium]|nr:V-type ATP synthase subunit F [Acidimicrobiales bacterium]